MPSMFLLLMQFEDTDDYLEDPNEKMKFYCSYMAIYLIVGRHVLLIFQIPCMDHCSCIA